MYEASQLTGVSKTSTSQLKLTDQTIDSKEYIKKYLNYTSSKTVGYESLISQAQHQDLALSEGTREDS